MTTTFPYLEEIHFYHCRNITNVGFISILNKTGVNMKKINMYNTKITFSEVDILRTTFPRLEELSVFGSVITDDMGFISFLNRTGGNLKKINVSDTNITLSEVGLLTVTFSRLEELNVSACRGITDVGFISFLNKAGDSLKKVDISRTRLTLSEVGLLTTTLPRLEELTVVNCRTITDSGFISLLNKTGDNLKKIDITYTNITLSEVDSLTISLSNLEELTMPYCCGITKVGLLSFLNKAGDSLRKLDISFTKITLLELCSLSTNFPRLEELKVIYCPCITDVGFISFLNKAGDNLKVINISNSNITLSEVDSLTTTLHRLEELYMSNCHNITNVGFIVSFLNKTGGDMKKISLRWTEDIAASEIKAFFPDIETSY